MWTTVRRLVRPSVWDVTPRDHRQGPAAFRRRQVVTVVGGVVGAVVLGWSLRIEPGSASFYPATLLLAAVWTSAAFASGPLHLGRIGLTDPRPRPIVAPVALGVLLAALFVAGALVVREVPALADRVRAVLDHAQEGSGPLVLLSTVAVGVSEELFFRGAAYAAIPRHPVAVTTGLYVLTTVVSANPMLIFAAAVLGTVVGLERRASGGVLAPILTHLTWSIAMLYALPAVLL